MRRDTCRTYVKQTASICLAYGGGLEWGIFAALGGERMALRGVRQAQVGTTTPGSREQPIMGVCGQPP